LGMRNRIVVVLYGSCCGRYRRTACMTEAVEEKLNFFAIGHLFDIDPCGIEPPNIGEE